MTTPLEHFLKKILLHKNSATLSIQIKQARMSIIPRTSALPNAAR